MQGQVKLGEVATFINGYPFKPTDWSRNGLEIIRIQNLTKSISSEANYYEGNLPNKYRVTKGDLLISWSATLDIFEWTGNDAWLNQHIFKVQFDKLEVDKRFFRFAIVNVIDKLRQQVHGATMQHITKGKFDATPIFLPPLSTQQRIAEILDKADALRKKDRQLLQHYDDLAQSLFIDMFGDPVRNEKGWEVKKIGEITTVTSGSTPSRQVDEYYNGTIPWVKTTEVNGNVIVSTEEHLSDLGLKNSSCKLYPPKSIIIAMYGQGKTRGQVGLLGIAAATNQACGVILPDGAFDEIFLYNYLKLSYKNLRSLGRGGNQENLNAGMIKDFQIIIPPIILQNQFTRQIQNIEQQKEKVKAQMQESEHLFQALLQKAFSGGLN